MAIESAMPSLRLYAGVHTYQNMSFRREDQRPDLSGVAPGCGLEAKDAGSMGCEDALDEGYTSVCPKSRAGADREDAHSRQAAVQPTLPPSPTITGSPTTYLPPPPAHKKGPCPTGQRPKKHGADGGTRTRTGLPATPSRWCVYQFHHIGTDLIITSLVPALPAPVPASRPARTAVPGPTGGRCCT